MLDEIIITAILFRLIGFHAPKHLKLFGFQIFWH